MYAAIARPWRPRVASALLMMLGALLLALVPGCAEFEGEPILRWNDDNSDLRIVVRSALRGGKTRVHLDVTRDGKTIRQVIVSDANLRHASLLRYNEWLLVLSGPYVIGGYDMDKARIVPANSAALPFTVRTMSGYVVDERRIAEGDDTPPFNFEARTDR